jgi:PAS domain S-box-containing protein
MSDFTTHRSQMISDKTTVMKRLERRMYTAFGTMIVLMIAVVLLSAGVYSQYALSRAQEDLSTVLTRILADSVSRISFSGKYQARLLLEDIKQEQPEIIFLLIADRDGQILAHSDPEFNDKRLDATSLQDATRVLQGSPREIRILLQNGSRIREVTLPYRTGLDHQLAGVIQVGLSDKHLLSSVVRGGWFALILGLTLLASGLIIGFIYINIQFVRPVRLMASQLEGILINAPTLISIRNSAGELVACSNAYRTFFGLGSEDQLLPNDKIFPPDEAATMDRYVAEIRENRRPVEFEMNVTDPNGDLRTFLVSGFPIHSNKGDVQLIGSFGVDLSDLRRTEQALRQSLAEAERASASKSEFLSRMSHELRTPLNAVIGFSQVLQNDPIDKLTEEQQDNVEEILQAGRHLLELINEILDLARIESGHMAISLEPFSILRLFEECRSLITPLADQRGISVEHISCCPEGSCICLLFCDPLRTRQVLLNLLSNAVKYNRDNGTVSMGCKSLDNGFCRISIRDTGTGIDEAFLPKLFEPFERAVPDGGGIEGSGIGLALAKRLVEAMGGQIGVETTMGQGSVFWFDLPAAGSLTEEAQSTGSLQKEENAADVDTTRYTILTIEDNPANQRLIRKMLASRPAVSLLETDNAEDGFELLRNCKIHLVLMDIHLPGMDGFEALAQLRSAVETAALPVIAISANALQSEVERALAAGFVAYLTKPVDVTRLLEQIDTFIQNFREEQDLDKC